MSNQTHLMAASSNGTTPRERGSNRDSERVSHDTPVYDLGISSPPAPAKHTSKGVLVTASVKVPLAVKEAWSREAARRGIKLSEHLRQMLQLVDQSWTEADKACPPEHAQRGKQPRRERRMGCAIARPWSPEHAAMLGAMLQIHAQLRQLSRNAGDAGQPASTAELIELNARLAQIHRRVESLCWDRVMRRSARSGEA